MDGRIRIVQGDITRFNADAVVNAANTTLLGGGGVDGAIHKAAGPGLLDECRNLKGCKAGEAKITKGYNLPAKFIIHTVGPVWHGGASGEKNLLSSCYINSLNIAVENSLSTICFPAISTGIYGFPFDQASGIALSSVQKFLESNSSLAQVAFILYSANDYDTFSRIFQKMSLSL
ncbi:MAG: O-acetyl-ADP-ribose deacetylase [Ignavibacteriae bacterium HGW-Ignavibacteriae-3]|nr:MAG: O-acetyl-ADP-ribose deacetylase [Ignavibacteriae bacterium HGW-Ignavibacteriae-3]